MGICDSEPKYRINEVLIKNSNLKPIDKNIIKVSPSVCKISSVVWMMCRKKYIHEIYLKEINLKVWDSHRQW